MNKTTFIVLICLLKYPQVSFMKFTKQQKQQQNCQQYTAYLQNLFNFVCGNIEAENQVIVQCRRCFSQAIRSNNNQPSINDIADCAAQYFPTTRYESCLNDINAASQTYNGQCVAGYCSFVQCLRGINADYLIYQCYSEANDLIDPDLEGSQAILYKNTTSCILARARCDSINPITGQRQTNTITITNYDKWGKPVTVQTPLYNSLQINRAGDLRIIALPGTTNVQNYFCSREVNLMQSDWLGYNC